MKLASAASCEWHAKAVIIEYVDVRLRKIKKRVQYSLINFNERDLERKYILNNNIR